MADLTGKRVAILATDGFEDSELTEPLRALSERGALVDIIAPKGEETTGQHGTKQAVKKTSEDVTASDYDALILPGGVQNGDSIRLDPHAVTFTRSFFEQHKPVGAICHGGWILADADVLQGRKMTSFPSLKTDLRNAGAQWVDEEVVVDNGLVTSRTPDDLPAFNDRLLELIAEDKADERH